MSATGEGVTTLAGILVSLPQEEKKQRKNMAHICAYSRILVNRNPSVGAYMRQIYLDLLYEDNTLVNTTAYGAVV